jgi:hypothetical protein
MTTRTERSNPPAHTFAGPRRDGNRTRTQPANMTSPQTHTLTQTLRDELDALAEFDQRLKEASDKHDQLAAEHGASLLKKRPDLAVIERLAASSATVALMKEARAGADARIRAAAVPVAREAMARYRGLRALQEKNIAQARALVARKLDGIIAPDGLENVLPHALLVKEAHRQKDCAPLCSVGYIAATDEVHEDVSAQQVLAEYEKVEAAYAAAEALAEKL